MILNPLNLKRSSLKQFLVLLCAVAVLSPSFARIARAQEPSSSPTPATQAIDRTELHQALLDLTNSWTVMCVAAHPDDEDGTTLTVLRRKYGVHTVSLFSTYGEGGQNAVGPELYEELGVIRAHETMKAARIQGSEPYFLGLKDFGFSKSADEAFRVWGHDEALRRMVLKIRELRPDVIITNHDTTTGHGHHQATGRLIIEAFDAAADPKRFPEQLNGLKPWQPQRLFVRIFSASQSTNKPASGKIIAIDPNEADPVRGISYAALSLAALQQHATQGPWPKSIGQWLKARGIENGKFPSVRYVLVREASPAQPLPDSAATLLDGLKLPASLSTKLVPPTIDTHPLTEFLDQPGRVVETLIKWRVSNPSSETSADDLHRLNLMQTRLNRAMAVASGVTMSITPHSTVLVQGVNTTFSISLANAGDRGVHVNQVKFRAWGDEVPAVQAADLLLPDTETIGSVIANTPANVPFTVPKEEHLYDDLFLGKRIEARADLEIDGAKFLVSAHENIDVAPAVAINKVSPSPCVRTLETLGQCKVFKVSLTNNLASPFRGTMRVGLANKGGGRAGQINHQIVLGPLETRDEPLLTNNAIPGREALSELKKSGSINISIYPLDSNNLITGRAVPIVFSAARVAPDLRIGYVASFDQTLEHALAALGVESKALTVDDIQNADLSVYKTIIIDNRGYEAHPELISANSHLLDFVRAGGTLIVFYHKPNEWNPDEKKNRPQLAPYPIVVGDDRVTDEGARINFLQPRHPLLNFPNRIAQADFKDWIQERGLNYPKEWDPHFSALFSTNDSGEAPLRGGLLVARYGRGDYIYTSMVWYRQLRAGVPGAYRMFANMISYGHR